MARAPSIDAPRRAPTRAAGRRLLGGLCAALLSWAASAADRDVVLAFEDVALTPGTAVRLKAKLLQQQPDFDFSDVRLRGVTVEAKSREGRGRVALRVGDSYSDSVQLGGSVQDYASTDAGTFYRVELANAQAAGGGVWQLLIAGYIRLRSVTLHLSAAPPAPI